MTVLRIEYFNQSQYRWSAVYETAVSNLEKAKARFFKMKEMKRIENPDGTITRNPFTRLVMSEKSCGRKHDYYKLLKIMEVRNI